MSMLMILYFTFQGVINDVKTFFYELFIDWSNESVTNPYG